MSTNTGAKKKSGGRGGGRGNGAGGSAAAGDELACRSVLTQDDLPMFVHARAH